MSRGEARRPDTSLDTSPDTSPDGSAARPSAAVPVALFALLALAIPAAGALSYGASAADLRRQKERELATIAAMKVNELARWRTERLVDADGIAAAPPLVALAADPRPAPAAVRAVEQWFETLRGLAPYVGISLVTAEGGVLASAGDHPLQRPDLEVARRALNEQRALVSGGRAHGAEGPLHVLVVAPVRGVTGGRAVVLWVDARDALEHMDLAWPSAAPGAETFLVRADGETALITDARAEGGSISIPLDRRRDPAVRAARGERGVFEGQDRTGRAVLAAAEPAPQTPWSVVAQVERDVALAPLRGFQRWVVLGVLALVAASGAGAMLWWRSQHDAFAGARQRDEAERLALARRVEQLTRFAQDMVFLTDDASRILEVNDRAVALLGFERRELLGMRMDELRDPTTLEDFPAKIDAQRRGAVLFETRYRRKDGSVFPVEVSAHSDVVDGRRYFHGIVRDITGRKQADEAVRASEAKFRAAFEFASVGILLVGPEGRLVETNRAIRRVLRLDDEGLRALTFEEIHAPQDRPSAAAILRQMREGTVGTVELPRRLRRNDGTIAEVVLRASALRDDAGAFRFALAVVEDVTEKRQLEAQLVFADRMASLGTLSAGVAHEINNPLSFILSNLDFALAELKEAGADPEVLGALADARDGGLRVREIVRDLKSFSRGEPDVQDAVDVRRVLQSAIGLAQNEIRHRARLDLDPGEVPPVQASEHRLAQVFLNLLINAAQAIPEGAADQHVVRVTTSTAPDGRAAIEVSDTGNGIPAEVLPRIFDPFFTTKPVGVGTGLGLSICHGIVTSLGGDIEVRSSPGQGTTFRVLLPPTGRPRPEAAAPEAAPAARRGRILVIDDEALVGRAVARILSSGHDVVARTSGRDALVDLARDRFDLVLCDLVMPDMTGMEVHAALRRLNPSLAERTIFLTGGAFMSTARAFLDAVPNPRLEKPFEPEALRAAVGEALARAAS